LRTNPAEIAKKLLTRMAAQGITVANMSQGGGAFDVKSVMDIIRGEIKQQMSPLVEQNKTQQQERERIQQQQHELNQVRGEVESFFSRNPEARRFIPTFQRVMRDPRYAGMSLGEVYVQILKNNRNRPEPSNRKRTPSVGSLPRGRGVPPDQNRQSGKQEPLAPLDASWGDIINGVLDEGGYKRAV